MRADICKDKTTTVDRDTYHEQVIDKPKAGAFSKCININLPPRIQKSNYYSSMIVNLMQQSTKSLH